MHRDQKENSIYTYTRNDTHGCLCIGETWVETSGKRYKKMVNYVYVRVRFSVGTAFL